LTERARNEHSPLDAELRLLGEALGSHSSDVLERVVARANADGASLPATVRSSFTRICVVATVTIARWMAEGEPQAGLQASREAWSVFGALAAHRAAPLNEVTKRCLFWRDAVNEVLGDRAEDLGVSPRALARAIAMTQATLDVTLVRVCEAFETERARTGDELARRQEELAFMATHDPLTGLPNRTLVIDRAARMLARARRRQGPVAALLVNVDNLTGINETLGHAAGDELLQGMAARLDGVVRESDALGRLGGDEFVVLADDLSLGAGPEAIAERLQESLRAPFKVTGSEGGETEVTVTASIGIAIGERTCAEELMRDADIAMHRAKWDGKNRLVVFESGMQDVVQSRVEMEMDLRSAMARDQFFLVYQPTFDLNGMVPTGVESLLRWRHPTKGVVQPNDFIPLLEETGMIVDVGRWVLHEAARQTAEWHREGHPIGVAVNVSGRQLDLDDFVEDVRAALSTSGLRPEALTLEITETALMRNAEATARRLHAVKELGVRIAIDDFGTGYSSLAHLQRFPVDALKIDRSFISRLSGNPEGEALVRTLVQLGEALNIETLAEGIEREHELALLQKERCRAGQGFLFSRPLEVDAARTFIANWLHRDAPAPTPAPTAG
jgi:diguanylate cyclase (GGDEF)-like protein